MTRSRITLLLLLFVVPGCSAGRNYENAAGPRYTGGGKPATAGVVDGGPFRIVTFNVQFARQADSAAAVLAHDRWLRKADIVLLQEMDDTATRRIASALELRYVYYPAVHYRRTGRDFGNAVLSRWPIIDDDKLLLPHTAFATGTRRIATAVTVCTPGGELRVYSVHLGTPVELAPSQQAEQLETVLSDAARYDRVIIGGDMNSGSVGRLAQREGYDWPTEEGPRTTRFGRWDHIFTRGLPPAPGRSSGTVTETRGASDHRPVWATVIPGDAGAAAGTRSECEGDTAGADSTAPLLSSRDPDP